MSLITIDGKNYDIGEVKLERSFELIADDLTAGQTLDKTSVIDIIAGKISYAFTIEPFDGALNPAFEYDAFIEDITAPKSPRRLTLPYGQTTITFDAVITSAADELLSAQDILRWGSLRIVFSPVKPQRMTDI